MTSSDDKARPVSLSEVKNILNKFSKEREELLYEQRIALEHAQMFAKLPVKKTNDMIKELVKLEFLEQVHAYKIADLLPNTKDDIKTIFAKERVTLSEDNTKKILEIVGKYYIK